MKGSKVSEHQTSYSGFLFALLAVVLWSGNFIVSRALNGSISPIALAFFRWLLATVVLFPIAFPKLRSEWRSTLPHAAYLSMTALAGVTIFNTLVYVAGRYTTATNMALIGTTASPVFVFLFSTVFLRQKHTRFQYAGIFLCIAGILLLLSKGNLYQLSRFRFTTGDLWILGAGLSFAIYTLLVRKKPASLSPLVFLFSLFFLGTLFLLPAFIFDSFFSEPVTWSLEVAGCLLYLGVGASLVSFLCWNSAIRQLGPSRTALFGNLIPVFSTVEAAWILNEEATSLTFISFAIILTGILVANLSMLKGLFKQNN